MSHKIMVMSPLHNIGATCVAELLAQGLTFDSKTATLLFTEIDSKLPTYLGIEEINDPTRSIMQMIRLVDNGALEDKDILDYAYSFSKNCWLMNSTDKSLIGSDYEQVITHTFKRAPTDVSVCDVSSDLETPLTTALLETADMLFIVTDMSEKCTEHCKAWLQSKKLQDFKNVYVIVNKYDETVMAVRNYAKKLGISSNRVCKFHYNPWIAKCCWTMSLHTILPLARELDPRVAALNNDINELIQCVNGSIILRMKKGF